MGIQSKITRDYYSDKRPYLYSLRKQGSGKTEIEYSCLRRKDRGTDCSEKGSAILWVLIAIVLFAALGFAFSKNTGTSVKMITDEQAKSYANHIISFSNDVQSAVKRLSLRGCDDTEISFENSIVTDYTNPNSPTDNRCHVFDVAGGGLIYTAPSDEWQDPFFSGLVSAGKYFFPARTCINGVGSGDTTCGSNGLDDEELMIILPFLNRQICMEINKIYGIDPGNEPPLDINCSFGVAAINLFTGTFGEFYEIRDAGDLLTGHPVGCHSALPGCSGTTEANYIFFNTLKAR